MKTNVHTENCFRSIEPDEYCDCDGIYEEVQLMRFAITALYKAAHWTPDRPVDAVGLWTVLRDAAGLPPGQSPVPIPAQVAAGPLHLEIDDSGYPEDITSSEPEANPTEPGRSSFSVAFQGPKDVALRYAHLFAAAPDLLEALKKADAALPSHGL